MAESGQAHGEFPEDQDYLVWLRYLECIGDQAMSARLETVRAVARSGRALVTRAEGPATSAPLIVAAEAAAAALAGRDEQWWRQDWTRRLIYLAVTWHEQPTTDGVICMLTLTDRVIDDLKAADVWPWPTDGREDVAEQARSEARLTYAADGDSVPGIHAVQGADYVVWHRMLEASGDGPVATRLAAIHAASQSKCRMTVRTADGRRLCYPTMIVAEGAIAAQEGKSEAQWREEWTRRCVRLVTQWPDPHTVDAAAALLSCTPSVVAELKYARVWPWLGVRKADRRAPRRSAEARPTSAPPA